MRKKVVVIGGGLGGLSAALTLSRHFDVHIIEKNEALGGKMQSINIGQHHFDYGPNTLTMPRYFWELVEPFGNPYMLLPFEKIQDPTIHQFANNKIIFSTSVRKMVEQIREIDEKSAENYPVFIQEIIRLFELSEASFLVKTFFTPWDYVSPKLAIDLLRTKPFTTLQELLESYFPHKEVQQLFARFATYIGSSPYEAPATFAMIAYFELVDGTYYIQNGASQIATVLEDLLVEQQVHIHTCEKVEEVVREGRSIIACKTDKAVHEADFFINNTDFDMFQPLLGREPANVEYSTSAYVELVALKYPVKMHHHNVLFSEDYSFEFEQLRTGQYAMEPTIYACYPYASDESCPPGLFVLINAPNGNVSAEGQARLIDEALAKWGIDRTNIIERTEFPPQFLQQYFNAYNGALYGRASNSFKGSFLRPANRDKRYKNLFYVGGTVHPGGGSPIVIKGGYEVAKRIIKLYA